MKYTIALVVILATIAVSGFLPAYAQSNTNSVSFFPVEKFETGDNPTDISLGDLNGDTYLDIVVTNGEPYYSNDIAVILSNGDGAFANRQLYNTGSGPYATAVDDFDVDGDLDIVVANHYSNNVLLMRNNGNGLFTNGPTYPTGIGPHSVKAGDLDGDGDLDLAMVTEHDSGVSVLLNNGDGTFAPSMNYSNVGSGPVGLTMGDFDGDTDLDIAIANVHGANITVMFNIGSGVFALHTLIAVGNNPGCITVGDYDKDGDLDMAVSNAASSTVSVLLNEGNGGFAPQVTYPTGVYSITFAQGDLNGDGDLDFVFPNWDENAVSILLNNGNGTFSPRKIIEAGINPHSVKMGDMDNDGDVDIVVSLYGEDKVLVLYNNTPPMISAILLPDSPAQITDAINATVEFSDPDVDDAHTVTWTWGDGSTTTASATAPSVTTSHTYTSTGVYTVTVTITDAAGEADTESFQYVVIYDPNGGFVTGGGWINSPAGAYTPDPTLTGKATFGFVSKYQKGANVPTGNTEFQFHVAGMNFKSTSYDWLVIAGTKAQYKGTGTVNGAGEYKFMLTAIDGTPDRFRIKIWNKETGETIYDNQLGASDNSSDATELGGGSIVIHKPK